MIKEIQKRKVDFILTDEKEKFIKEARGTDALIKIIRENTPQSIEEVEKLKEIVRTAKELTDKKQLEQKLNSLDEKSRFFAEAEILYHKFLENRRGPEIEKYEIAIKTGKEFINKYGDEKRINKAYSDEFILKFKEVIEYVKNQIPRLEKTFMDLKYIGY